MKQFAIEPIFGSAELGSCGLQYRFQQCWMLIATVALWIFVVGYLRRDSSVGGDVGRDFFTGFIDDITLEATSQGRA
jgi:hypothetical protein